MSQKISVERRLAVVLIAVVMTVTLIAAALACGAKAIPTSTPTPVTTPAVYERFLAALTATAAASPADAPAVPPASPKDPYPFEVVYRDYDELRIDSQDAFGRLLALAPDTPHTREQIWLNNLASFWNLWERAGVARPTAADGPSAYRDGLRDVIDRLPDLGIALVDIPFPISDPWIAGFGDRSYIRMVNFFEYAGVDARNVDGMLRTGWGWEQGLSTGRPIDSLEIAMGTYRADAVAEAIASCAECVPHDQNALDGMSYMSWAGDYQPSISNRLKGPFLDPFGRGGRVAVFDGAIYRALSTAGIELLLDTRQGHAPNLAQDLDYKLAVAGLIALNAHAAVVSSTDFSLDGLRERLASNCFAPDLKAGGTCQVAVAAETRNATGTPVSAPSLVSSPGPNGWEIAQTSPLLKPFSVAAFANFSDTGTTGRGSAIVLVHKDPESAQSNVEPLLRRLAETQVPEGELLYAHDIERVEIGTAGRVLLMKIFLKPGLYFSHFLELPTMTMVPPAAHE